MAGDSRGGMLPDYFYKKILRKGFMGKKEIRDREIFLPNIDMKTTKEIARKQKDKLITVVWSPAFGPVDEVMEIFVNGKRLPNDQWKLIKGKGNKPDTVKILKKGIKVGDKIIGLDGTPYVCKREVVGSKRNPFLPIKKGGMKVYE